MPELAEVEYYRRIWAEGLGSRQIVAVVTSGRRPFRGHTGLLHRLRGSRLVRSASAAKQMLFQFRGSSQEYWLGVHLGMSGELRVEAPDVELGVHDHLVLRTPNAAAIYNDPRMFGRIDLHIGSEPPPWWIRIAPPILSAEFTSEAVSAYLQRRRRAPLKAVLLQQERFPGVGNWMADEILWRAALHPARAAGTLTKAEIASLWRACRHVCRMALQVIAGKGGKRPSSLNAGIPETWLFRHRWAPGGRDPLTGGLLKRSVIGGRTTCWSPDRQTLPAQGTPTVNRRPAGS